jgi:hypothetical protein
MPISVVLNDSTKEPSAWWTVSWQGAPFLAGVNSNRTRSGCTLKKCNMQPDNRNRRACADSYGIAHLRAAPLLHFENDWVPWTGLGHGNFRTPRSSG